MEKYKFHATNLVAEAFEKHDIKFRVEEADDAEIIIAGFSIDGGPTVAEWFICDDENDIAARVFRLITKVPETKLARVSDACNILNSKVRFLKFFVDTDGDVNVEYDFPKRTPDNGIGEMAAELFLRTMHVLDVHYRVLMKALYTDENLNDNESLMQKLERLRRMQRARAASEANATDADVPDCSEAEREECDASD